MELSPYPIGGREVSQSTGARVGLAMVLVALIAGCHGGPQTDVYERELRWQEDQIYALKSYLDEYHQELRRSRRENAKLKRQLKSAAAPTPQAVPQVPAVELDVEETLPLVPEVELGEPGAARSRFQPHVKASHHEFGEVQVASWQRPDSEPAAGGVGGVGLHGQIHESQAGQFLSTTVETFSADGSSAEFCGALSLMLLDSASGTPSQPLTRWDFTAEEVNQAKASGDSPTAISFELPLQEALPAERPVQLWVRLVDEDGKKWLNSAEIDLGRSFEFASVESAKEGRKSPVARFEPLPTTPRAETISVDDGGWSVTWPGQPPEVQSRHADWTPSSQLIPAVTTRPRVPKEKPAAKRETAVSELPKWSPER